MIYLPAISPVGPGEMGNSAPVTQIPSDQSLSDQRVRFGVFEVDFRSGELRKGGVKVKLHAQPLAVLNILLERAGDIVTREELQQKLWGNNTFVDFEHGLNKTINKLRDALSDKADTPRYIETLPRRGYRFIAPVTTPTPAAEPPAGPEPKSKSHFVLGAAIAVAGLLAFGIYWFGFRNRAQHAAAVPTKAMLAVLPFENISGDDSEDYFADGLTEEMIAQLGQLQPTNLGVIARTSAMRYKHTKESIAQIGHELGVNYLLEGSVRLVGQRVRITAQLIQAGDQTHLWAESYETPLTDILKIQREIAERITGSLRLELLPTQKNTVTEAHFDPEAYRKYLLGLNEVRNGTHEGQKKAIQYFQDAIAIDPEDARPYAALAEAYSAAVPYYMGPKEPGPGQQAVQKHWRSILVPQRRTTMGDTHLLVDWNWQPQKQSTIARLNSIPTCRKLIWGMKFISQLWDGTTKQSPTPGKPFASTRSPSRPARGLFGWTTSQGTCRRRSTKPSGLWSWNRRRHFLMRSSRLPMLTSAGKTKRCRQHRTHCASAPTVGA